MRSDRPLALVLREPSYPPPPPPGIGIRPEVTRTADGSIITITRDPEGNITGKTLEVAHSVESIPDRAYFNNELTGVSFHSALASIGKESFAQNRLTSLAIPPSVTSLEESAFADNSGIENVTLSQYILNRAHPTAFPRGVTFKNDAGTEIAVETNEEETTDPQGSVITATTNKVTGRLMGKDLTLSPSLETIGSAAYKNNDLTSVTIPPSITAIGPSAFQDNDLTSVTIPRYLANSPGDFAFAGNENLTEVIISQYLLNRTGTNVFPPGVTFKDHDGNWITRNSVITTTHTLDGSTITTIKTADDKIISRALVISSSVTSIHPEAYRNKGLTSVTIPSSVISIGASAFRDNSLTSLTIPDSVTSLGDFAFAGNSGLTEVTLSQKRLNRTRTNVFPPGVTFKDHADNPITPNPFIERTTTADGSTITVTKNAEGQIFGKNLALLSSLTSIADGAYRNTGLTSLTIPSNSLLTSIGASAFRDNSLTSVSIPTGVTSLGDFAFAGNSGLTEVTISQALLRDTNGNAFPAYAAFKTHDGGEMKKLTNGSVITTRKNSSGVVISKDLYIPPSVTSIEQRAFENNQLTSVTIPSSVTSIGYSAFAGNQLKSVTIPSSVTSIEYSTFAGNQLTSVTIPSSVTSIGSGAFAGNQLKSVTIPSSVTSIGDRAFRSNSLTSVFIPTSVTSLGYDAFAGNSTLTDVTISKTLLSHTYNSEFPTSVTFKNHSGNEMQRAKHNSIITIQKNSSGAVTNRDLFIPSEVRSNEVRSIGDRAFSNNELTSVTIPSSVTSIGDYAFSNNELTSVTIPSSVTSIGDGAFGGNSLTSVFIPTSVTSLGDYAFAGNSTLTDVTITQNLLDRTKTNVFPSKATLNDHRGNSISRRPVIETTTTADGSTITTTKMGAVITAKTLSISPSLTAIGANAYENIGLTSITIPSSVTSIGSGAFLRNQLKSVDIPSSVTSIGNYAFSRNSLESVDIPSSVTSIGDGAFDSNSLTSVSIPTSVTSLGDYAFAYNRYLTEVILSLSLLDRTNTNVFPSGVTFKNHAKDVITKRFFHSTEIWSDGSIIKTIRRGGTSGRIIAKSLTISSSVTSIRNRAFENNQLTSVTIPSSVTSIGKRAFENNQLTSVTIPSSVKSIGRSAFFRNQLESVTIPSSVKSIGNSAFRNNRLTSVSIPTSVTSLGDSAFAGNNTLTDVTISNISLSASHNNTFPTSVTFKNYSGNEMQKAKQNSIITIQKNSSGAVTGRDLFIPSKVRYIGDGAFRDNNLTSVEIPSRVTSIGTSAFAGNQLKSVTIPSSVTSIGDGAFRDNNLTSVSIPTSVTSLGDSAFAGNNTLTDVTISNISLSASHNNTFPTSVTFKNYSGNEMQKAKQNSIITIQKNSSGAVTNRDLFIPSSVTVIGYSAFRNNQLTSVTIPSSVKVIRAGAFSDNNLTSVRIPYGVTEIGQHAFENNRLTSVEIPSSVNSLSGFNNNRLYSVRIPYGVTEIGWQAFDNNRLESVRIPSSVTDIGRQAFRNNRLTSVTIPSRVTYIGNSAFANNRYLRSVTISKFLFEYLRDFSPSALPRGVTFKYHKEDN